MKEKIKVKSRGGKREGAGRKKVNNPKSPVVIYVEELKITNLGGIDKLKNSLLEFIDERNKPFINAENARDELSNFQKILKNSKKGTRLLNQNGEVVYDSDRLPTTVQDEPKQWEEPKIENNEILEQIKAIKDEKIPKDRDTFFGRKSWTLDQQKRISELKNKQ